MGLNIDATLVCDKDGVTTVPVADIYNPLPVDWLRAQGYMGPAKVDGFFCPTCIAAFGTRALFKFACDESADLTDV